MYSVRGHVVVGGLKVAYKSETEENVRFDHFVLFLLVVKPADLFNRKNILQITSVCGHGF